MGTPIISLYLSFCTIEIPKQLFFFCPSISFFVNSFLILFQFSFVYLFVNVNLFAFRWFEREKFNKNIFRFAKCTSLTVDCWWENNSLFLNGKINWKEKKHKTIKWIELKRKIFSCVESKKREKEDSFMCVLVCKVCTKWMVQKLKLNWQWNHLLCLIWHTKQIPHDAQCSFTHIHSFTSRFFASFLFFFGLEREYKYTHTHLNSQAGSQAPTHAYITHV